MPKRKELSDNERQELIGDLLDRSYMQDGERKLARGAVPDSANKFQMSRQQVYRIWNEALAERAKSGQYVVVSKKSQCGRRQIYNRDEILAEVEAIPMEKRGTNLDLAKELGISKSLAWKLIRREKILAPHSCAVKPLLSEHDKVMRMLYCANRVKKQNNRYFFERNDNQIHVDEKWFDMTPMKQTTYVTQSEKEKNKVPQHKTKHKSHIVKVMFVCAVAKPIFNDDGECIFDGKIACVPIVEKVRAKVSSKNRSAGTIETKVAPLTKETYKYIMLKDILPAAAAKMGPKPTTRSRWIRKTILVQQDNPHTHFKSTDKDWQEASLYEHPDVEFHMTEQPARSPDLNVLDLGFFRSLQSKVWKLKHKNTVDGIIESVFKAWNEYDPRALEKIWVSHQTVMDEVLKNNGDNDFNIPHLSKDAQWKNGPLPSQLELSEHAITSYNGFLQN